MTKKTANINPIALPAARVDVGKVKECAISATLASIDCTRDALDMIGLEALFIKEMEGKEGLQAARSMCAYDFFIKHSKSVAGICQSSETKIAEMIGLAVQVTLYDVLTLGLGRDEEDIEDMKEDKLKV